jgi:glycosyltransferase involved in cell wall biosynthesis
MRRLRIAIVTPGFVVDRDDPSMPAVVDLVERLAEAHDVEVITLRHPPRRASYAVAGARVRALGAGTRAGPVGRATVLARGVRAVLAVHRRRPVDVIHGLWADEAGAVATFAARLVRRPSVVSFMGGELARLPDIGYGAALGRGGRWTVSISCRLADLLTAGSGLAREQVLEHAGSTPVALLPLGVDVRAFRPVAAEDGAGGGVRAEPPTVLFVGSLEPVKDPATAVEAFAAVAAGHEGLRLELVGDGQLRGDLEDRARRLGVGDRVAFRGQLPRRELPGVYRRASVLVVSSRHEGQSMVAVEAAASGIPVIGTRVGVLPDLGDGALTVPVSDGGAPVATLAAVMATVLDDPALAARMGAAGRAVAIARFDIERTVTDLLERYDGLVTNGSGRGRRP